MTQCNLNIVNYCKSDDNGLRFVRAQLTTSVFIIVVIIHCYCRDGQSSICETARTDYIRRPNDSLYDRKRKKEGAKKISFCRIFTSC